ncbi:MAG: hypothetical protein ABL879_14660 [Devosia sp.]
MSIDLGIDSPSGHRASPRKARAKITSKPVEPCLLPSEVLTAGRLIALLEDYDPEAPVVIEGQYGGFEWVRRTSRVPLRLNVNSLEGFGPHDRADRAKAADAMAVAILVQPATAVFEE